MSCPQEVVDASRQCSRRVVSADGAFRRSAVARLPTPTVAMGKECSIGVLTRKTDGAARTIDWIIGSKAPAFVLSEPAHPNDLWCADYKGEFMLADKRYCYPLTITDSASRYLLCCEALEATKEIYAFTVFERFSRTLACRWRSAPTMASPSPAAAPSSG